MERQRETNADMVISRMCCFENETANVVWALFSEQFDLSQVIYGKSACLLTILNWLIGLNSNMHKKELDNGPFPFSKGDWANLVYS